VAARNVHDQDSPRWRNALEYLWRGRRKGISRLVNSVRVYPALLVLCVGLVSACGERAVCSVDDFPFGGRYCNNSIVLSLRGSSSVQIAQDDVVRLYSLLRPAWLTYPPLRASQADDHRSSEPNRVDVQTTNVAIVSHWDQGEVATGDPMVDQVFVGNGAFEVVRLFAGEYSVSFSRPINMRAFAPLVAVLPATQLDDMQLLPIGWDISLSVVSDGVVADFMQSWGDCFVQCDGTHHYIVLLSDSGEAQLVSESGPTVPQDVLANWSSRPPPD
jgi:hypothetical protein